MRCLKTPTGSFTRLTAWRFALVEEHWRADETGWEGGSLGTWEVVGLRFWGLGGSERWALVMELNAINR